MDFTKAWSELNWIAVIVAAFSAFLVGGLWYTVFDKIWKKANGFTPDFLKSRNMGMVFIVSFILSFIMALNLALFVGKSGFEFGLIAGTLTGLGFVIPAFVIIGLFEKRTLAYLLVNSGYILVSFILMGGIVGIWQ